MIGVDFDRIEAELLEPLLRARGWERTAPGHYQRSTEAGVARCVVDPDRSFSRFRVMIGLDPPDVVALVAELSPNQSADGRGFLCPCYVTPAGVFRRHSGYDCRTKKAMESSIAQVVRAIDLHSASWFERMSDPVFFAQQADPVAALLCGFAWERAGDQERAKVHYEEMWRRLEGAFADLTPTKLRAVEVSTKKMYLFVAERLGHQTAVRTALEQAFSQTAG